VGRCGRIDGIAADRLPFIGPATTLAWQRPSVQQGFSSKRRPNASRLESIGPPPRRRTARASADHARTLITSAIPDPEFRAGRAGQGLLGSISTRRGWGRRRFSSCTGVVTRSCPRSPGVHIAATWWALNTRIPRSQVGQQSRMSPHPRRRATSQNHAPPRCEGGVVGNQATVGEAFSGLSLHGTASSWSESRLHSGPPSSGSAYRAFPPRGFAHHQHLSCGLKPLASCTFSLRGWRGLPAPITTEGLGPDPPGFRRNRAGAVGFNGPAGKSWVVSRSEPRAVKAEVGPRFAASMSASRPERPAPPHPSAPAWRCDPADSRQRLERGPAGGAILHRVRVVGDHVGRNRPAPAPAASPVLQGRQQSGIATCPAFVGLRALLPGSGPCSGNDGSWPHRLSGRGTTTVLAEAAARRQLSRPSPRTRARTDSSGPQRGRRDGHFGHGVRASLQAVSWRQHGCALALVEFLAIPYTLKCW